MNETDLWKFSAKNSGNENLNAVYTLSITYNDTLLYESSTKSMLVASEDSIYVDLKFEEPPLKNWLVNNYKRMVMREGDFLPGEYKICLTAFGANEKNQPDKNKIFGTECVTHTIDNYENNAVMDIQIKNPEKGKLLLSDIWNFTTTNKSISKQIVEVCCRLTFDGQDMFYGCSRTFIIKPGETQDLMLNFNQAISSEFKIQSMRDNILKTGMFPPGKYNLCLIVRSEWSKKEFGSNCIEQTVE